MELCLDWNDLRYFLAVARLHSLTEASRELRVSQATIARRIAALEHTIGRGLFAKRHDGYSLTTAGEALFEPAEQAEAHLLWLERGAAFPAESLAGIVRLAIPELLGQHFIIPSLADFSERHPSIRLEVIADVRPMRLSRREADVLVRLVHPTQGDYLVRRVGRIALALYGSPAYLAAHGSPAVPSDLLNHRMIGWEAELGFLPFSRWLLDALPETNVVFRAHTMSAQLAAVEANLGLAVLPAFVAKKFGLVRVLKEEAPFSSDIWMLQAPGSGSFARVRVLADHVAEALQQSSAHFMDLG